MRMIALTRRSLGLPGEAEPLGERVPLPAVLHRPQLRIEIAGPARFLAVEAEWRDLAARALAANAFMEPALVAAAAATTDRPIHVILAWDGTGGARLVGAWALAECPAFSALPFAVLKAPVHGHAALGIPVVDRGAPAAVLDAMLQAVAEAPGLPKVMDVFALHVSGPMGAAMDEVFARRRLRVLRLDPRRRPWLETSAPPAPPSRSRAKSLRQKLRRLAEAGEVRVTRETGRDGFEAALDDFLALEAAGWKGRGGGRGRAILGTPALAAFFRAALLPLGAEGLAGFTTLRLAGRPVAMQLSLFSGRGAFTWKTAYDESLKACGPGILLLQEVTAALREARTVEEADACTHRDDGYMAEFWSGRLEVADAIFDVRPGLSARFCLAGGGAYLLWRLKRRARIVRARALPRLQALRARFRGPA